MIDPQHPRLSIQRKCRLASISRSAFYYQPTAETPLNQLSNRIFDSYDAIVDACSKAWNDLIADPDRIRSIGSRDYAAVNL